MVVKVSAENESLRPRAVVGIFFAVSSAQHSVVFPWGKFVKSNSIFFFSAIKWKSEHPSQWKKSVFQFSLQHYTSNQTYFSNLRFFLKKKLFTSLMSYPTNCWPCKTLILTLPINDPDTSQTFQPDSPLLALFMHKELAGLTYEGLGFEECEHRNLPSKFKTWSYIIGMKTGRVRFGCM